MENTTREIKFRIWDKKVKCFFMPNLKVIKSGKDTFTFGFSEAPIDNYPLMQYTGLKDKNGKEIYEGDIVVGKAEGEPFKSAVRYVDGYFSNCSVMGRDWYDYLEDMQRIDNIKRDIPINKDGADVVVIGNIYENPELLK